MSIQRREIIGGKIDRFVIHNHLAVPIKCRTRCWMELPAMCPTGNLIHIHSCLIREIDRRGCSRRGCRERCGLLCCATLCQQQQEYGEESQNIAPKWERALLRCLPVTIHLCVLSTNHFFLTICQDDCIPFPYRGNCHAHSHGSYASYSYCKDRHIDPKIGIAHASCSQMSVLNSNYYISLPTKKVTAGKDPFSG